jgi:hypothetical protein
MLRAQEGPRGRSKQRKAVGEGEGAMTRKIEKLRLQKGIFGVCVID